MKWLFEAERELAGIWTTAALSPDASVLYFGANKGGMYALNTRDGSLKWKSPSSARSTARRRSMRKARCIPAAVSSTCYALDSASGEIVGDYAPAPPSGARPSIRPDGTLVVADRSSRVLVLGES